MTLGGKRAPRRRPLVTPLRNYFSPAVAHAPPSLLFFKYTPVTDMNNQGDQVHPAIDGDTWIRPPQVNRSRVPENCYLEPNVILNDVELFKNIKVGLGSYMNRGLIRSNTHIGRYTSIGRDVLIGVAQHPLQWLTTHPLVFDPVFKNSEAKFIPKGGTTIGNDVWIGDRAIIQQGVSIGDGAVIGSAAVVTKDVEPYSINVGCPARCIKYRFDSHTRELLADLKWWTLPPSTLRHLPFHDIQRCILAVSALKQLQPPLADCHIDLNITQRQQP